MPLLDGLRVASYEVRNTGGRRPPSPLPHRFVDLVGDLERVVRATDFDDFVVVAHSHGARIAAAYALRHPGRVAGMIWITPGLEPSRGGYPDARDDLSLVRWSRSRMPGLFADPSRAAGFAAKLRGAPAPSSVAARGVQEDPGEVLDRLGEIESPTLLVSGAADPLVTPQQIEDYRRRLPRAVHECMEDSGHHPWYEEPESFRKVVSDFVSELG